MFQGDELSGAIPDNPSDDSRLCRARVSAAAADPGTPPHHQFEGQHHLPGGGRRAAEDLQQQGDGTLAEGLRRLGDGGQRGIAVGGEGDVVEARQRQVLGHSQARAAKALQGADRHLVAAAEQRGGPLR